MLFFSVVFFSSVQGFLAIVMDHAASGDLLKRVDAAKNSAPLEEELLDLDPGDGSTWSRAPGNPLRAVSWTSTWDGEVAPWQLRYLNWWHDHLRIEAAYFNMELSATESSWESLIQWLEWLEYLRASASLWILQYGPSRGNRKHDLIAKSYKNPICGSVNDSNLSVPRETCHIGWSNSRTRPAELNSSWSILIFGLNKLKLVNSEKNIYWQGINIHHECCILSWLACIVDSLWYMQSVAWLGIKQTCES